MTTLYYPPYPSYGYPCPAAPLIALPMSTVLAHMTLLTVLTCSQCTGGTGYALQEAVHQGSGQGLINQAMHQSIMPGLINHAWTNQSCLD